MSILRLSMPCFAWSEQDVFVLSNPFLRGIQLNAYFWLRSYFRDTPKSVSGRPKLTLSANSYVCLSVFNRFAEPYIRQLSAQTARTEFTLISSLFVLPGLALPSHTRLLKCWQHMHGNLLMWRNNMYSHDSAESRWTTGSTCWKGTEDTLLTAALIG